MRLTAIGGDETPVRAQILQAKWPHRDRNSRWVALRGCCRRCRRRLSVFWPRRGAKPDHLFRYALRADGMADLARMRSCFAASCCPALPSLCRRRATRASPNKEEDAGERRKSKQMRQEESSRRRIRTEEKAGDITTTAGSGSRQQRAGTATEHPASSDRRGLPASCSKPEAGRGGARRRQRQWAAFALRCCWLARCALKWRKMARFGRKYDFLRHHPRV